MHRELIKVFYKSKQCQILTKHFLNSLFIYRIL